ncbi:hypothetical protein WKH31_11925 [Metabacillus indicus]|uniref:hypothetical protein n=1 Tax=Metabacillus indicus TaxID=246786 RepID=UPI00317ACE0D
MLKSKWFFISLIGLSITVMILSALPMFMKPPAEGAASMPQGLPPMNEMPAGGMPGGGLPENVDMFEVQQLMEEVEKNGGLTPELKQQAEELGLPDQMLGMMETAAPPKALNIVSAGAMIMGTIVIVFSTYRLYKLRKSKQTGNVQ